MEINMREWLMQGWNLEWEIEALMNARAEMLERCLGSSSPELGRVAGSKSIRNSAMESYIELSEKLNRRIDELCDVKSEILDVIALLPESRMRAVMTERYVVCSTWEAIAEHMNTEVRNLFRIHTAALKLLEKEETGLVISARTGKIKIKI